MSLSFNMTAFRNFIIYIHIQFFFTIFSLNLLIAFLLNNILASFFIRWIIEIILNFLLFIFTINLVCEIIIFGISRYLFIWATRAFLRWVKLCDMRILIKILFDMRIKIALQTFGVIEKITIRTTINGLSLYCG